MAKHLNVGSLGIYTWQRDAAGGNRLEEADQVISSGLIDGGGMEFGHWER